MVAVWMHWKYQKNDNNFDFLCGPWTHWFYVLIHFSVVKQSALYFSGIPIVMLGFKCPLFPVNNAKFLWMKMESLCCTILVRYYFIHDGCVCIITFQVCFTIVTFIEVQAFCQWLKSVVLWVWTQNNLKPSAPVYKIFVLRKPTLMPYFCTTLQLHNSPGGKAKELLKPSRCGNSSSLHFL